MTTAAIDKIRSVVERLPTPRDEDWKYTDLGKAREISARWLESGADVPEASIQKRADRIMSAIDAEWIVIANGRLQASPALDGLIINPIDPATAVDVFGELNSALGNQALQLSVSAAIETPIGLLILDDVGGESVVVSTQVTLDIAPGCSCELIEHRESIGEGELFANGELSLTLGDGASVNVARIQCRGQHHVETTRMTSVLGKDANLNMLSIDLGGRLIRNDTNIDLASRGAHANFNGVYLAGEGQHIDNHTRVDHRVGPATSQQEYRGILTGRCRCVWNGKAIVHEGADGTDAQQGNHNLLLSEHAEIDAKPELEIYADDVKCAHGTTVGQLDERSLYYLRTRGIDQEQAKQMLTQAFAAGLVNACPVESARQVIADQVEDRLSELVGEQRS